MKAWNIFTLPITEPVIIFLIMLLVIFIAPRLLRFFRIPGIIGFIIAGLLIGPHGFGLIAENNSGIELFSTFGLLYIMFLLGLELDMIDFRKNMSKSYVFGLLTFAIPLVTGFFICYYLLGLSFFPALLLASMFSTQTLISYPIVNRLGLTRHTNTAIVVGGTIITDTAVLMLLAIVINTMNGKPDVYVWLQMISAIALLVIAMLWVIPKLVSWLFKKLAGNVEGEFLVLMLVLFSAALLSMIAGVEPMIGAFLAGLALNRLVPYSSTLMKRTIFIGNTLFIPIFLISVGMIVDLRVFVQGYEALEITLILIVTALITKYLAAWATQLIYGLKTVDRNYIFGLSASHAAATIALVVIGFNAGLFDIRILNGSIGVIFISCLVSSFFTENSGKRLAIISHLSDEKKTMQTQRILVPVANPATMPELINFAILMKDVESSDPVYPLSIFVGDVDNETAEQQLREMDATVRRVIRETTISDIAFSPVTRVDINVAAGINRAIKELMITQVLIGWTEKVTGLSNFFGTVVDNVASKNNQMIVVAKLEENASYYRRLVVLMPPDAEYEKGFETWVKMLAGIARQLSLKVVFCGNMPCIEQCKLLVADRKMMMVAEYVEMKGASPLEELEEQMHRHDLLAFISARPRTISYSSYIKDLPKNLSKKFPGRDYLIIFPEQAGNTNKPSAETIDGLADSPIRENIERIEKLGKAIGRSIKKK
jgi:Kef-type K+ transport system membrane component KefB